MTNEWPWQMGRKGKLMKMNETKQAQIVAVAAQFEAVEQGLELLAELLDKQGCVGLLADMVEGLDVKLYKIYEQWKETV